MAKNRPKILIFCRPYLITDFKKNVAPLESEFHFQYLTDGVCKGVIDTRKRFYARLENPVQCSLMTRIDEDDIIERCRLLRNIDPALALNMVRSIASILFEEIEIFKPTAIFSQMVDEYITHTLSVIAKKKGLCFFGIAGSYFPDHAQLTLDSNGSPFNFRNPSEVEIDTVSKLISDRLFRQDYKQPKPFTLLGHAIAVLRTLIKKLIFSLRKYWEQDPLNLHYTCLPFVAARHRLADFPRTSDFHLDWRDRLQSAQSQLNRKIVYFPLAYYPEATTNYWIGNKEILNYDEMALEICRIMAVDFDVVAKEHLHMIGCRERSFYRKLSNIPGVISVPPLEFSNEVLEISDIVVIGGGSIGVESYLRGKPILSFCDTSYWFENSCAAFLDLSNLDGWSNIINSTIKKHVVATEVEKRAFLKSCLSSTSSVVKSGRVWPICDVNDIRLALNHAVAQGKK
jgi:hypothetical protein